MEARLSRQAADQRAARIGTTVESGCARRTFAGRDLVDRVRSGTGHDRIAAASGNGRVHAVAADHGRHPDHSLVGLRVVSRRCHGLHPHRWRVHGGARQLRAPDRADRCCGLVDRLRGDRGGPACGRDRGRGVRDTAAASVPPRTHGRHPDPDLHREPARFAAIGPDFRGRDVLVRRHDSADDRDRPDS